MTDAEALELAVARTGHRRFRDLLDPAHPAYDPRYWPTVRAIAARADESPRPVVTAVEPPAPVFSLATIARLKPLASACPYAVTPMFRGCGCRGCAHLCRDVSLAECLGCVAALVRLDNG